MLVPPSSKWWRHLRCCDCWLCEL